MAIIYAVKCVNGLAYIGCTKANLAKRMREHRCMMRAGTHHSPRMNQDWVLYGNDGFTICELEQVSDTVRNERETEWIRLYGALDRLYNAKPKAFGFCSDEHKSKAIEGARLSTGNRWTSEANMKRSLAQRGIPKGHGAKISATKRAKQAMR